MRQDPSNRRDFLGTGTVAAVATAVNSPAVWARASDAPAILGGSPVRKKAFQNWPIISENDLKELVEVLKSGLWNRLNGPVVGRFEKAWADRLGSKHCLATANGTSALFTALNALGVGPGDEVIVPPYTFVATINVVLLQHALPVFVDTDPRSFQIDAQKIEAAMTDSTTCIMPVHLGGAPADLDTILEIGRKQNVPILEDACQAHLAEWRHKKVSTLGTLGCFSFQASKNLNSGEGGAIATQDDRLIAECRSFHNNGRAAPGSGFALGRNGCNLRLTEFQGSLLLSQLTRLEDQSRVREQNAAYLTEQLRQIPGLTPAQPHAGCTRNAYHLYMFRYDAEKFDGLPRSAFLKAMAAEGIPASGGYSPLNKEPFLANTLNSRAYKTIYPAKRLRDALERMSNLPVNDQLCEEAVWFTQTILLGGRSDMDQIVEAIRKIQRHAPAVKAKA